MERITPKIDFSTELADLFNLNEKVVYIPGGYGGIGEAIAWGLVLRGATVVVAGRSSDKASLLAQQLVDAASVPEIRESVDWVVDTYGSVDILVNCVGIQREESILEVTEEAFDAVHTVNLKAAMFLAQAVARR